MLSSAEIAVSEMITLSLNRVSVKIFLSIEALIYFSFLSLDIIGGYDIFSWILRYAGVCLCFLFFITEKNFLITLAQVFVLIADRFLLFSSDNLSFCLGILFFIPAQLCYFLFLEKKQTWLCIIPLFMALVAYFISGELMISLAAMYGGLLIINLIRGISCGNQLYFAGIVLLFLCDINVAINNLISLNQLGMPMLYRVSSILMWFFYLPSQIMFCLCGCKAEKATVSIRERLQKYLS